MNGAGFVSGAVVRWNGHALATKFISEIKLTATVPASDIGKAGTASITVANPQSGQLTSNVAFLSITNPVTSPVFDGVLFPTLGSPVQSITGDFNNDGILDLAVSNWETNLAVLLGNGDGTFQPDYSVPNGGDGPLCTGDFNGDGILDLAVAVENDVVISLGKGDGTFLPPVEYGGGSGADSVVAADVNGDGKLDLVTGNYGSASVWLGRGDGSFGAPSTYTTTPDTYNLATVADVNGDGKMDIAITTNGDIAVLLGNGDGTFEPPNYFQGATFPEAITFADFNQDGTMDLALSASGYPTGAGAYVALQTDGASLMFSPTILVFATQLDGTQRSPQSITLTNVGSADLVISKITLNGTDASSFVQKNNCKAGLAPGASCDVSVAFTPKGRGPLGVSLFIADNTLARQQSVPLSGVGSWATLTPASLKFGNQKIGTTSPPQTLTLTNIGSGVFSIRAVLVRDFHPTQFTQSNNCGKSLAAGTSCAITVQFVPTEKGQWQNIVEVRTTPADRFKNPS